MRRLVFLTALAAASLVAATATASSTITAPPTTYTSPSGDSGTAPDIVGASATNDDHGLYTLTTTFAGAFGTNGMLIFLDTDRNASTGDAAGAEYVIVGAPGSSTMLQWSASANDFVDATSKSSLTFSVSSDGKTTTTTINKSDIGNTNAFDFGLLSVDGAADPNADLDRPRRRDRLVRTTRRRSFTLSVGSSHPTAAKAGGAWTVSMSRDPLRHERHRRLRGHVSRAAARWARSLAVASHAFVVRRRSTSAECVFKVPKADKHKKLHATVTVSENGQTATQSFSATAK